MMTVQRCQLAATASHCLEKANVLLLALQPAGADLMLVLGLEVLLWTA